MNDSLRGPLMFLGILMGLLLVAAGGFRAILVVSAPDTSLDAWAYPTDPINATMEPNGSTGASEVESSGGEDVGAPGAENGTHNATIQLNSVTVPGPTEGPGIGPRLALGWGISLFVVGCASVVAAPMISRMRDPPRGHRHALQARARKPRDR